MRLRVSVKTLSRWRRMFIKRRILRQLSVRRRTLALIEHQHSLRGAGSAARVLYFDIYIPSTRGAVAVRAPSGCQDRSRSLDLCPPHPPLLPRVSKCAGLCWSEEKRRLWNYSSSDGFFFRPLSNCRTHIQYEAVDILDWMYNTVVNCLVIFGTVGVGTLLHKQEEVSDDSFLSGSLLLDIH